MIELNANTTDTLSLIGIQHFFSKMGLVVDGEDETDNKITINYGKITKDPYTINIAQNEVSYERFGEIRISEMNIPIFERPFETNGTGTKLVYYRDTQGLYPCISCSANEVNIGFDIFKEIGFLLSGKLEKIWDDSLPISCNYRKDIPVVDILESLLFDIIRHSHNMIQVPLVRKSIWPNSYNFGVCLTHDVDEVKKTYQWITRPIKFLKAKKYGLIKSQFHSLILRIKGVEPYWTFEKLLSNEQELGVKSSFYFLDEHGKTDPLNPQTWHVLGRCRNIDTEEIFNLIKKLQSEGHEIGLHGSTYSYTDSGLLKTEKERLESIVGHQVIGIRQHRLNLQIPETWKIQESLGFKYDTTLGFKASDGMGFRWGTSFPFHLYFDGKQSSLLEIPLIIMDVSFEHNDENGDYNALIAQIEDHHGVVTVLWHPPVFNDLEYPGFTEKYVELIERCKKRGAWVTCAGDIYHWWKKRENSRFSYQYHDGELSIFAGENQGPDYIDLYLWDINKLDNISDNVSIISKKDDSITLLWNDKTLPVKVSIRQSDS